MSKAKASWGVAAPPAYSMGGSNDCLPTSGGLAHLTTEAVGPAGVHREAFADPGECGWVDPRALERHLDADPALRKAAAAAIGELEGLEGRARDRVLAKALEKLGARVQAVFEEALLLEICERFERVRPLVARYALAKEAVRAISPDRLTINEDKK
jgi:hypothetical protein